MSAEETVEMLNVAKMTFTQFKKQSAYLGRKGVKATASVKKATEFKDASEVNGVNEVRTLPNSRGEPVEAKFWRASGVKDTIEQWLAQMQKNGDLVWYQGMDPGLIYLKVMFDKGDDYISLVVATMNHEHGDAADNMQLLAAIEELERA